MIDEEVRKLIEALKDKDWFVRFIAAIRLGEIGDRAAVPALTAALGDANRYVRAKAAEALGSIGDRAVTCADRSAQGPRLGNPRHRYRGAWPP